MMRIITGSARGLKLEAPEGLTTRPTSERAKMGVFNILQFEIAGKRVLDLFAGSGQMGLEALSRGAASALFCDADPEAFAVVKRNAAKARLSEKCRFVNVDYKDALRSASGREQFDLIFLDPPYGAHLLSDVLHRIASLRLLADGGYLVIEDEREEPWEAEGTVLHRFTSYGRLHITILKKEKTDNESTDSREL